MMPTDKQATGVIPPTDEGRPGAIVVGTGRCGSTTLSRIFRKHPAILSLSEFFVLLEGPIFEPGIVEAEQFWKVIGQPSRRLGEIVRRNIHMSEMLYPTDGSTRFGVEIGIPPILFVTLPHLTDDYEELYNEIKEVVSQFPPTTMADHYKRLFAWLKQSFGRRVIVERSGASLPLLPSLLQLFPTTKFVHLIRDGRSCAYSMSRHTGFRLMAAIETYQKERGASDEEDEQRANERIVSISQGAISLSTFGRMWGGMILKGINDLRQLPQEHVLTVFYEDLVAQPQQMLCDLANFIDSSLFNEEWGQEAAGILEARPAAWKLLPPEEREALETACEPGMAGVELLRQEGLHSTHLAERIQQLLTDQEVVAN